MDILKILFILVLLTIPLGEITRIQLGNGIAFTLNTLLVCLSSGIFLLQVYLSRNLKKYFGSDYTKPIIIFIGVSFLSLLINVKDLTLFEGFTSFLYLLRWIMYIIIFFVMLNFDNHFKEFVKKLIFTIGALILAIGYLQYIFFLDTKKLFNLGWDEHMYRMVSTFLDPNYLGSFLVLYLLFVLSKYFEKKYYIYLLTAFFTIIGIFLTFSRSAILMMLISVSIYFLLLNKRRYILIILGVLIFFFIITYRYFYIENINPFRIVSSEARLETARNAITIFRDNPILGIGFNSYKFAQVKYGFRNEQNILFSHADASPDNSFLFILATTGILGFLAYLYIWVNFLKNFNPYILSLIIGIFVNSMFVNSLFYPFIMLWIWITFGLEEKIRD